MIPAVGDQPRCTDDSGEQGLFYAGFIPHHDDLLLTHHRALELLQGVLVGLALHHSPAVLIHAYMEFYGIQAFYTQGADQAQAEAGGIGMDIINWS